MKHLKFIFSLYSKNWLSAILLIFVTSVSLFTLTNAIGKYQFYHYSLDLFSSTKLNDHDVYFMPFVSEDQRKDPESNYLSMEQATSNTVQQIKNTAGVEAVIQSPFLISGEYKGNSLLMAIYDRELNEKFSLPLETGTWFRNTAKTKNAEAIAGGYSFQNVQVGSAIHVEYKKRNGITKEIDLKIVGKLKDPSAFPNFSLSGTTIFADDIWKWQDVLILNQKNLPDDVGKDAQVSGSNFFISIRSQANYDAALRSIEQFGTVKPYRKILSDSSINAENKIRQNLPIPLFFLFISSMTQLSVSVLFVNKKIPEFGIYYLYGCTKFRYFCSLMICITALALVSVLINFVMVVEYPALLHYGILNLGHVVFDCRQIFSFVLPYEIISLLCSILFCFSIFRKKTPIELYRRLES